MPSETVVYELPGMGDVDVLAGRTYKTVAGAPLLLDVYRPRRGGQPPVVVFVHGDGPPSNLKGL